MVISSFVAHGGVGLRAAMSVFDAAGVEVIAVPTIILSSHLGHAHCAGRELAADDIDAMRAALERDGALAGVDAVMTGFMPTAAHVSLARRAIDTVRRLNPEAIALVDPIMGDDPEGLYVNDDVAAAIGAELIAAADVLTPNRFELARLSGRPVNDVESAKTAMAELRPPMIAATSIPDGEGSLATLLRHAGGVEVVRKPRLATAAHGTGDLFAALLLIGILNKRSASDALDLALEKFEWRDIHA
ncbi:MAG: PfkB family carbohydrate kinase [Hyphomicrobium sp.]